MTGRAAHSFYLLPIAVALFTAIIGTTIDIVPEQQSKEQALYDSLMDSAVYGLEDISYLYATEWVMFLPLSMPFEDSFLKPVSQPVPLIIDSSKKTTSTAYPSAFMEGLVPVVKEGITFYPIQILLNSKSRELTVYNADGAIIATLPVDDGFLPIEWTRVCIGNDDPLYADRMQLCVDLILEEDLRLYVKLQELKEKAEKSTAQLPPPIILKAYTGPALTNIQITSAERISNTIVLTIAYPWTSGDPTNSFTNRFEIFACTNLIPFWWTSLGTTNPSSATNWIEWTDTSYTNHSIRFYVAGNADQDVDADGLADAAEKFVYHTVSTNRDSDSDGLVDGYSGVVSNNDYPAGAHTNNGQYVEGELSWDTDPNMTDTDEDGMEDGWEVSNGRDPMNDNDPPNVRGSIIYTGGQTGAIYVIAVTSSNSWSTNSSCQISGAGSYRVPNLLLTNYWVKAYMDSNSNSTNDTREAWGWYATNEIEITNKVTGIDITLADPDDDSDSLPDWWEVLYFGSIATYTSTSDPDSDTYNNLEEYTADTDPTNALSHPWNLSGSVSYSGVQTGNVIVAAYTSASSVVALQAATNASTGSYTITHLPPDTNYWIKSWRDTDGNGSNIYWEASASYVSNPVYISTNVTNINITLADADSDEDEVPDYWELSYGMDPLSGGRTNTAGWWRLDESSGTTVNDSSVNANTGVLYNASSTPWVSGVISNALSLDGIDDYVQLTNNASLQPEYVSISLWIKPAISYASGSAMFFSKVQAGASTGYSLGYENGALKFLIYASGGKSISNTCALTNGVWHHVAGTYGGDHLRLYLDGVLLVTSNYDWGTSSSAINQGAVNPRIGATADSTPSNYFCGIIDDVAVFGEELSSNAVYGISELGADFDADGVSNFEQSKRDTDNDGLPDWWEVLYFGSVTNQIGSGDFDSDNLANSNEYIWATSPANSDTDADGLSDGAEVTARTDPNNSDTNAPVIIITMPVDQCLRMVMP